MSIFAAILGGVLSAIAGKQQSDAAESAAAAQARAARDQLNFSKQIYGETVNRFAPFYGAGTNALGAYLSELGLGEAPAGYGGYQTSPGYQWRMDQGRDMALSAGRGSLSGATLGALQRQGQGIADSDYQNYLSRLGGLVDTGQAAAGNQANAGANYLQAGNNAYGNIGNAQAAGAIGQGNAWSDAIGNIVGGFGYMNGQQAGQAVGGAGGGGFGNFLSGLF